MEQKPPLCLTLSNRQDAAADEPCSLLTSSTSSTPLDASESNWPTNPEVKDEHLDDEIKENHNIYEQLVQICTEMSVKRYVETSESETIKQEIKTEEDSRELAKLEPQITIKIQEDDGIDTADLSRRIQHELSRFEISQAIFARKILNRSQGTLSDLLKRPQPWAALRSGRHTYQRMADWLLLPDEQKLLLKVTDDSGKFWAEDEVKTLFDDSLFVQTEIVIRPRQHESTKLCLLICKRTHCMQSSK
jgi:CUT domain